MPFIMTLYQVLGVPAEKYSTGEAGVLVDHAVLFEISITMLVHQLDHHFIS